MLEWLGLHWILMLIVTVVMVIAAFALFGIGGTNEKTWMVVLGMGLGAAANIPMIGFLIGVIVAIAQYVKD